MSDHFWLSDEQLKHIEPYFPLSHGVPRRIGRAKGGLNSKLHAVCDGQGRPVILFYPKDK